MMGAGTSRRLSLLTSHRQYLLMGRQELSGDHARLLLVNVLRWRRAPHVLMGFEAIL